jgi:hypothetical protein
MRRMMVMKVFFKKLKSWYKWWKDRIGIFKFYEESLGGSG